MEGDWISESHMVPTGLSHILSFPRLRIDYRLKGTGLAVSSCFYPVQEFYNTDGPQSPLAGLNAPTSPVISPGTLDLQQLPFPSSLIPLYQRCLSKSFKKSQRMSH